MTRSSLSEPEAPWTVGQYQLFDAVASGGMGVVHLGRALREGGMSRIVAIKRLHAELALDQEFVRMLAEEARLSARVRHPNVASVLDIADTTLDVLLVMEYLEGETLYRLTRASLERGQRVPPAIASAILGGALLGLQAAHEARSEKGEPLRIVHRDVSPQNILVGADGIPRVLDFGVAKATSRTTVTARGAPKGKLTYMAPEQARGDALDHRADLFAAGVVLWEILLGERLFAADDPAAILARVLTAPIPAPSRKLPGLPEALDRVVLKALQRDPARRYASAEHMAIDLEEACPPATQRQVAAWVMALAGPRILERRQRCAEIEALPSAFTSYPELSPTALQAIPAIQPVSPSPTPQPATPSPPSAPASVLSAPASASSPSAPRLALRRLAPLGAALLVAGLGALFLLSRPAPPLAPRATSAVSAPSTAPLPSPAASSVSSVSSAAPMTSGSAAPAPSPPERKPRKNARQPRR